MLFFCNFLDMLGEFCAIIKEFKIVDLTLTKRMAFDGIRNPILRTKNGVSLLVDTD